MKRIFFITGLLLLAAQVYAPGNPTIALVILPAINEYDKLIEAIVRVESQGDSRAFNMIEQAVGPFQIRPIKLKDYNQRTNADYQMKDCFDYDFSRQVFLFYARGKSYEQAARNWNGSGEQTTEYWNKIKAAL